MHMLRRGGNINCYIVGDVGFLLKVVRQRTRVEGKMLASSNDVILYCTIRETD